MCLLNFFVKQKELKLKPEKKIKTDNLIKFLPLYKNNFLFIRIRLILKVELKQIFLKPKRTLKIIKKKVFLNKSYELNFLKILFSIFILLMRMFCNSISWWNFWFISFCTSTMWMINRIHSNSTNYRFFSRKITQFIWAINNIFFKYIIVSSNSTNIRI